MTSVEHDPTIPTSNAYRWATEYEEAKTKAARETTEHGGKFYFLRAFWTIFGGLLAWTVWVLIPAAVATVVILLAGGLGAVMPDEDPIGEPGSDFSLACDPATEQC